MMLLFLIRTVLVMMICAMIFTSIDSFHPTIGYLSKRVVSGSSSLRYHERSTLISINFEPPLFSSKVAASHPIDHSKKFSSLFSTTVNTDQSEKKNWLVTIQSKFLQFVRAIRLFFQRILSILAQPFTLPKDKEPILANNNDATIEERRKAARYLSIPSVTVPKVVSVPKYQPPNVTEYVQKQLQSLSSISKTASSSLTTSSISSSAKATASVIDDKLIAGRKYVENRLREIQELNNKKQQIIVPPVSESGQIAAQSSPALNEPQSSNPLLSSGLKKREVLKSIESIKLADLQDKSAYRLLTERQLKTIQYLLQHGAKVFLLPSYGSPVENGKYVEELSTKQFLTPLKELLSSQSDATTEIAFIPDVIGTSLGSVLHWNSDASVFLFENLLFYSKQVLENDESLGKAIGKNFDIYVNDDDSSSLNQISASNSAIPNQIPNKVLGFALQADLNEIEREAITDNTAIYWKERFPALSVIDSIVIQS